MDTSYTRPVPDFPPCDDVCGALEEHVRGFFNRRQIETFTWAAGPILEENPHFRVLRIAPGSQGGVWTYVSVGGWAATVAASWVSGTRSPSVNRGCRGRSATICCSRCLTRSGPISRPATLAIVTFSFCGYSPSPMRNATGRSHPDSSRWSRGSMTWRCATGRSIEPPWSEGQRSHTRLTVRGPADGVKGQRLEPAVGGPWTHGAVLTSLIRA